MADGVEFKFDAGAALSGLDKLSGEMKTHLARSMAVAGGKIVRDEAKARAPVYVPGQGRNGKPQRINKKSAQTPGALRDSIYLAYREQQSEPPRLSWRPFGLSQAALA